jgi:hypothetical protein
MDSNRYAPPVAVVGEPPEEAPAPRPKPVVWAVRLLWATLLLSLVQLYIEAMGATSVHAMLAGLIGSAIGIAIACVLNVCIGRGRNWARLVTLGFTLLSTAVVAFGPGLARPSAFERVFIPLNTVSDIVCICLLFTPAASQWFRRRIRRPAG